MNTSLAAPKQLTPPRTPSTALPQLPPELAPPLVAMFAPLAVWAANWSETPSAEALVAVALCGGGAALVTGLMNLIYRDRPRAALAALLVVVYTFGYGLLFEAIVRLAALHPAFMIRDQVLRIVCNVGLILALAALRRWRPEVSGLMRGAGLFALLLTAAALVSLGRGAVGERGADEAILPPEIAALPEQTAEPPRDIYYLVFDRYADAETLREHFAWDNGPFLAALRERGFAVAEEARANYPKTEISIASSLNMRYHGNQLGSAGHYRRQMAEHEVGRLLQGHG